MHERPVKVVVLGRRAPGSLLERFRAWAAVEIAARFAALGSATRQVQSPTCPPATGGRDPIYDVVHELWCADEATARRLSAAPTFASLTADSALDRASQAVLHFEEHLVKDLGRPAGGVKSIEFVTRRADLLRPEFHRDWREVHGSVAARITQ